MAAGSWDVWSATASITTNKTADRLKRRISPNTIGRPMVIGNMAVRMKATSIGTMPKDTTSAAS